MNTIQLAPRDSLGTIAVRVLEVLERASVAGRLFGGIAISRLAPWEAVFGYERPQKDIDIAVPQEEIQTAVDVLRSNGWDFDPRTLIFNEARKIQARHHVLRVRLDLFSDPLQLNQNIHLAERIRLWRWTITSTDLLLTKLQVVQPNKKDIFDLVALLAVSSIGETDRSSSINANRLRDACTNWGLYHSSQLNAERIRTISENETAIPANTRQLLLVRHSELLRAIEPRQTLWWKIRAAIGTRLPWYNDVD